MPEKETYPNMAEWVHASQNGEAQAFGNIYDALVKPIYRYIYYKVPIQIAEDLTEETFFKAWKNIKKYKSSASSFHSWVFRIAHNLVCDYYRQHEDNLELSENIAVPQEDQPDRQTEAQLTQDYLKKAIHQLKEPYRQVILLRFVNELSPSEMAQILEKSEGAVRTLQTRAIKQLREILEKNGKSETKS